MAKAELKTKPTTDSVAKFLAAIPDKDRRADCKAIADMMAKVSKAKPKMWGSSMVGFGDYHFIGASGREVDWFMVGFSPRKQAISVHLMSGLGHQAELLAKLGKHKTGVGCLNIKRLEDVDFTVLTKMVTAAVTKLKKG